MRYFAPAMLAAMLITGCACNQRQEQPAEPAPLLSDIPVLGQSFAAAPETTPKTQEAASQGVPLLADIPILGHLFRRQPDGEQR
jgi:type II secretory pathway component GspD/PulD (secretin)